MTLYLHLGPPPSSLLARELAEPAAVVITVPRWDLTPADLAGLRDVLRAEAREDTRTALFASLPGGAR